MFYDVLENRLTSAARVARSDRHDHMQPLAAACLQPCLQAQFAQQRSEQYSAFLDPGPGHTVARIEIEDNAIRSTDVAGGRVPGMQFDHVHLGCAGERTDRGNLEQSIVLRPQRWVEDLHLGNRQLLDMFLKEEFPLNARRCANKRAGSASQMRQDPFGNALVVAHKIDFGEAAARIDDPVGVS